MQKPIVIKIGGNEIDNPTFLMELASTIKALHEPVIVVHGGGKEISEMQTRLGIEPKYVNGVRVTDEASLHIVTMMLCGAVNKRLVQVLVNGGVDALGLSGIDRGIVRARKMQHDIIDMGFTGEVEAVRGEALLDLLQQGITPVLAPISLGDDSHYNVNADHVAGAVAAAVGAEKVVFITNVEGVLSDGQVVHSLTAEQVEALIGAGTIFGGMIPKVQTALGALESGVPQAVITNLVGLKSHGGTVFVNDCSA